MPNPAKHRYAQKPAHDMLMLLISALAQNPGIGNRRVDAVDVDAMEVIQGEMVKIAGEQGISYKPFSISTLRLDIRYLKEVGIIPSGTTLHRGYYLGKKNP